MSGPPPIPPRPNFEGESGSGAGNVEMTPDVEIEEINIDAVGDALREVNLSSMDSVLSDSVDWDSVAEQSVEDIVMPQNRAVSITADTTGYKPQSYNPLSEKTFTSLTDLVHSSAFKEMKPNWTVAQSEYVGDRLLMRQQFERRSRGSNSDENCCNGGSGIGFSFDWVKFEIIRDFLQILGLFIAGIQWPQEFREWLGALAEFIAIDFTILIPELTSLGVFWITTALGFALMGAFWWKNKQDPDLIRDGHEVKDWQERSAGELLSIQVTLTLLTTLYMPISRNAIQMFVCYPSFAAELTDGCYGALHIFHIVMCLPIILVITFFLPRKCYQIIQQNKPEEVKYDEEGREQIYTDEDYKKDLEKDKCPYKFLYKGYERKWAFYKVIIMVVKLALILAVILFQTLPFIQAIISISILALFTALSLFTAPFIKHEDDRIDQSGRVTTLVTVALGYGRILEGSSDPWYPIFMNLINILNLIIMLFFALYGFQFFKTRIKNLTQRADFTEGMKWNLRKERKLRIWHAFWDSLFLNVEEFSPCADRLVELKEVAAEIGLERYREAILPISKEVAQERKFVKENLEGVDVFWDGGKRRRAMQQDEETGVVVTQDHFAEEENEEEEGNGKGKYNNLKGSKSSDKRKALKSKTCFGKMYITQFPFKCVIVYDDSDEYEFIDGKDFVEFAQLNRDPEIRRRRNLRMKLRALNNEMVNFEVTKEKTKEIGAGEAKRRLQVTFKYKVGKLEIRANKNTAWAPGFHIRIAYEDGRGEAEGHVWAQDRLEIGAKELGLDDQFSESEEIKRLFNDEQNKPIIAKNFKALIEKAKKYRTDLTNEQLEKEHHLSNGFWYYVYNNDVLPRDELVQFLQVFEAKDEVINLPEQHAAGLDYLYGRLEFYDSHPVLAYWYVFFSDFWEQNRLMANFKDHELQWSPQSPSSVCYNLMLENDFVKFAEAQGMRDEKGKGLLNDKIISKLYFNLTELCKETGKSMAEVSGEAKPVSFVKPEYDMERNNEDSGMGVALGNNAGGIRFT